jgi:hypothetical protein
MRRQKEEQKIGTREANRDEFALKAEFNNIPDPNARTRRCLRKHLLALCGVKPSSQTYSPENRKLEHTKQQFATRPQVGMEQKAPIDCYLFPFALTPCPTLYFSVTRSSTTVLTSHLVVTS